MSEPKDYSSANGGPPWEAVPKVTRTFVVTDIENSTATWARVGDAYRPALDQHAQLVREQMERHGGQELYEAGDGFLLAFTEPLAALHCAQELQTRLSTAEWPAVVGTLKVRISLHVGEVELRPNREYRGPVLNRNSRILSSAHGGQIVCSAAFASELAGAAEFIEAGIFRLRGFPEPERIYQVCWPGMPRRDFPPLTSPRAFVHNLPPSFTSFVGREREIAALRTMILEHAAASSTGGSRGGLLATLTGPGGTGKTRLSLAVAESLCTQFSDAVWFIPLADLHDARLLAATVRDALQIKSESDTEAIDDIVAFLAAEPALLVFDNFEQLGQDGAGFIRSLISRLPKLRCLVTSRERLRLSGEREFSVPPLAAPRPGVPAEHLLEYESVQLYVERARDVRSSFQITAKNGPAIAELCAKLEGIPLAIELAAAKAHVVTPQETVKALNGRLDFFRNENEGVPARHRTLRAAIDWSYDFLPPPLREFFANLAVFRGGLDAASAGAIAAPEGLDSVATNALRALGELRGTSLLNAEEIDGTMRFRMLETLRQYAEERLNARPDADEVRARHRAYFLALAQEAEPELQKNGQEEWLARLEMEHDNFRAVFARYPRHAESLSMATALVRFWIVRGYGAEGRQWLDILRSSATDAPERVAASAANAAGILLWSNGDLIAARRAFEEALGYFRKIGVVENIASILSNVAIVARTSGDLAGARSSAEESVAIFRALPPDERKRHLGQMSQALSNLGGILVAQDDPLAAQTVLREAIAIGREVGDRFGVGVSLHNLGLALLEHGDRSAAKKALEESFTIRKRIGDRGNAANAFLGLAKLALLEERYEEAGRFYAACQRASELFGVSFTDREMSIQTRDEQTILAALSTEALHSLRREGEIMVHEAFPPQHASGENS